MTFDLEPDLDYAKVGMPDNGSLLRRSRIEQGRNASGGRMLLRRPLHEVQWTSALQRPKRSGESEAENEPKGSRSACARSKKKQGVRKSVLPVSFFSTETQGFEPWCRYNPTNAFRVRRVMATSLRLHNRFLRSEHSSYFIGKI